MRATDTMNSSLHCAKRILKDKQFEQKRSNMVSHRDVQASVDDLNKEALNGPELLTQRTISMPVLKTRKGQSRRRSAQERMITDLRRKRNKTTKANIEANKIACILNLQSETSGRSLSNNASVDDTRIQVRKTLEHTISQS
jgi:hypothetical protein